MFIFVVVSCCISCVNLFITIATSIKKEDKPIRLNSQSSILTKERGEEIKELSLVHLIKTNIFIKEYLERIEI